MTTPTITLGINRRISGPSQQRQYIHTAKPSPIINSGSDTPSATSAGIARARSGVTKTPTEPPNPPFDSPTSKAAAPIARYSHRLGAVTMVAILSYAGNISFQDRAADKLTQQRIVGHE